MVRLAIHVYVRVRVTLYCDTFPLDRKPLSSSKKRWNSNECFESFLKPRRLAKNFRLNKNVQVRLPIQQWKISFWLNYGSFEKINNLHIKDSHFFSKNSKNNWYYIGICFCDELRNIIIAISLSCLLCPCRLQYDKWAIWKRIILIF